MPAPARRLFPMLAVADLGQSIAFYGGLLGGLEVYRFPDDEPVFVTLRVGTSELGLGALGAEPLHGQAQRPATGHRVELCVEVDDVDETVAVARSAGTPVVVEPADRPWGERVAYLADPDGNLVLLTAPTAAPSAG